MRRGKGQAPVIWRPSFQRGLSEFGAVLDGFAEMQCSLVIRNIDYSIRHFLCPHLENGDKNSHIMKLVGHYVTPFRVLTECLAYAFICGFAFVGVTCWENSRMLFQSSELFC